MTFSYTIAIISQDKSRRFHCFCSIALMLKAAANEGSFGENAIVINASKCDIIMGTIGIIAGNSMLGELLFILINAIYRLPD